VKLPWGLRWWELLPEAVLGLGLGLFLVTEPDAATSAFESTRALVLMAVVTATWVAARIALARWARWPALRVAVFAVAAGAVLVVVVLPAYDDTTVVEALPGAARPATDEPSAPATQPAGAPDAETTSTVATGPVPLHTGALHGIDHRASGRAVVYRQPDGTHLVGLEEIDIQPGPDYDVYVVPGADRTDLDGATRVDDLRGNKGTQYYAVPTGAEVGTGTWTVLVWCETFDVPIAGATPV
jgi:hypothetical protein